MQLKRLRDTYLFSHWFFFLLQLILYTMHFHRKKEPRMVRGHREQSVLLTQTELQDLRGWHCQKESLQAKCTYARY